MQLRDFEGNAGKRDYYMAKPESITVEKGYNVRDLSTPEAKTSLQELKNSIAANGLRVPLRCRFDGEKLILVQGHRRLKAVMELIKEGHEIESVPYIPDEKHMSEADRIVDLVVSNSGQPLSQLEKADVVQRLLNFGWDEAKIAARLGLSPSSVANLVILLSADEDVRDMVRNGDVAAQAAVVATRAAKGKGGAKASLDRAKEAAQASGRGKASVRDVAKATGDTSALSKSEVKRLVAALKWIDEKDPEGRFGDRARKVLGDLGLLVDL